MNRDDALRLRGRCSVWGCEEPVFSESLCPHHHAHAYHLAPKAAPGSETLRSLNRTKKTRRPPGRTAAGPPQGYSQRPAYPARQGDSTPSYSNNAFPNAFTHQAPNYQNSHQMMQHPPISGLQNHAWPGHKRTAADVIEVNASTVRVETMPPRPREPYFVLNPEFTSIDKRHSAYSHPRHNQGISQSRHVSSPTVPQRNFDFVGGSVDTGRNVVSSLNFPAAQPLPSPSNMPNAIQKTPPEVAPSARVGDVKLEVSSTITVAQTQSRRRPEPANAHKREGSTIHVYQKPAQSFKENLPMHLSPRKRKADTSDAQPRGKEPFSKQKLEASPTLPALEREPPGPRFSNQPRDGHQTIPLGTLSKNQGLKPSDDQNTTQLRNPKTIRASGKLMPMIEVALARANEQLENHTFLIQVDNNDGQKPAYSAQQSRQPEPRANGVDDEQASIATQPASTLGISLPVADNTITVATQNITRPSTATEPRISENHKLVKAPFFDSEAFDTMIYRQSTLHPPPGVSIQAPSQPKTPIQKPLMDDHGQYLAINPAIHFPYNRSEEWHRQKALDIQSRGGRKAWFGKVIERRRWLRAKEEADGEWNTSVPKKARVDPRPWSYDRIVDFGDVPQEELPEDVLQNPAWVKACAWHRENQAKRVLRDRATRNANREAWTEAERAMEDAKLVSRRGRPKR